MKKDMLDRLPLDDSFVLLNISTFENLFFSWVELDRCTLYVTLLPCVTWSPSSWPKWKRKWWEWKRWRKWWRCAFTSFNHDNEKGKKKNSKATRERVSIRLLNLSRFVMLSRPEHLPFPAVDSTRCRLHINIYSAYMWKLSLLKKRTLRLRSKVYVTCRMYHGAKHDSRTTRPSTSLSWATKREFGSGQ